MMGAVKSYLNDFHVRWILASSVVLNVALFLFFILFIGQSNVPIVLHYNVDWGVDYFGEVKSVFVLPFVGLFILLFNSVLTLRLWPRNAAVSYVLTAIILLAQVFLWLAGVALYIINS